MRCPCEGVGGLPFLKAAGMNVSLRVESPATESEHQMPWHTESDLILIEAKKMPFTFHSGRLASPFDPRTSVAVEERQ